MKAVQLHLIIISLIYYLFARSRQYFLKLWLDLTVLITADKRFVLQVWHLPFTMGFCAFILA